MADLKAHQEAIQSLNSRSLRLSYALQNFSDIRKIHKIVVDPSTRGGGRTLPPRIPFLIPNRQWPNPYLVGEFVISELIFCENGWSF